MRTFKYIVQLNVVFAISILMLFSCMEKNDWDVDSSYDRLFSTSEITVRATDSEATLEWSKPANTDYFIIEVSTDSLHNDIELGSTAGSIVYGTDKSIKSSPIIITGLSSSTKYYLRLKGYSEIKPESKWFYHSSYYFTTRAEVEEQLFSPVGNEDKTSTSTTLRWTPGELVTHIILQEGDNPEVRINLDDVDVAAGAKLIEDLSASTTYTAYLYNEEKKRGEITFTTLIDTGAGNSIVVEPTDDLKALLEGADNGDTFVLNSGIYNTETINVSKSISIIGMDSDNKPMLKDVVFKPEGDAALTLKNLILDGAEANDGSQVIVYPAGSNFGDLVIEDCDIKNYVKGVLYLNNNTLVNSITITKCIFSDIECAGGDFIDFRNGATRTLLFAENTVSNCSKTRDLFRMDAGGSTNNPSVIGTITVNNNTFDKVALGSSSRIFYIRLGANFSVTANNNIFSNTTATYSNQSVTQQSIDNATSMIGNNYFNAPRLFDTAERVHDNSGTHTILDPEYQDAANGDFTVNNSALKTAHVGDPRWLQ